MHSAVSDGESWCIFWFVQERSSRRCRWLELTSLRAHQEEKKYQQHCQCKTWQRSSHMCGRAATAANANWTSCKFFQARRLCSPRSWAVAPKAKPQETRWNKTKPIQIILHTSLHFQHCTQIRFRILHAKPCPNNASNSCSISSLFFSKVSAKGWGNLAWVGHFQMLKLLNIAFSRALGDSTVKLWFEALAKEAKQKPRQQTASRDATR